MSKTTSNDLLKTYSGIFGNKVILKNRNGKIIMTIPVPRKSSKPTEKQSAYRRKFKLASRYATNILKDPEMLEAYRAKVRKGMTPYNVALKDFLKPPYINRIDASGYHGNPGDKISVAAGDDFKLTEVSVQVIGPDSIVIEQGVCILTLPTGNYEYTATTRVADLAGITIIAKARDLPGHIVGLAITAGMQ